MSKTHPHYRRDITWILLFLLLALLLPCVVDGDGDGDQCKCKSDKEEGGEKVDKNLVKKYKIGALVSILVASAVGVTLPMLSRIFPALHPEKDFFFMVKAFAAGVILSTGFIHVLPDAFEKLTPPSLCHHPWDDFPFAGFVAMVAAIGTLMVDSLATAYFKKSTLSAMDRVADDEDLHEHNRHATHHSHSHSHSHASMSSPSTNLLRHRVISQVLELGIVVHSVIIGISLGASEDPKTIRPLIAALTFHQFFEGMGLGGSISQAKFKRRVVIIMALFFSLTTPVGIAIGMIISSRYEEENPMALIVEGILNAASAGILIYMSLVDLLAPDLMNPKIQASNKLQIGVNTSLLIGTGCMSLLAKWA